MDILFKGIPMNGFEQLCQNELDWLEITIAKLDRANQDATSEHIIRKALKEKGMKPTIKPFCYNCGKLQVIGFGALCSLCFKHKYEK